VLQFSPGLAQSNAVFVWVYEQNWLYHTCLLLLFTVAVMVLVSLVTAPKPEESLAGLSYGSISAADAREVRESWNGWDVFHTAVICGVIVIVYLLFW